MLSRPPPAPGQGNHPSSLKPQQLDIRPLPEMATSGRTFVVSNSQETIVGARRMEQPGKVMVAAASFILTRATTPWLRRARTSGSSPWSPPPTRPLGSCGASESTPSPRRSVYPGAPCVSNRSLLNDDQSSVLADALFASISTYRATALRSSSLSGTNLNPKVCTPSSWFT